MARVLDCFGLAVPEAGSAPLQQVQEEKVDTTAGACGQVVAPAVAQRTVNSLLVLRDSTAVLGSKDTPETEGEGAHRQSLYMRGVCRAALSHHIDNASLDMFRLSAYMDDFAAIVVGHSGPGGVRVVEQVREKLELAGEEVNLPFGEEKWLAGAPTEVVVSLGLGFDASDVTKPRVFVPDAAVTELVFLLKELSTKMTAPEKWMQSLAMKLQRATMVVPVGKLYTCGMFAALRLVGIRRSAERLRKRRQAKREEGPKRTWGGYPKVDTGTDIKEMVPVTKWAKRNAAWWLAYFENGSPRECCLWPKVTFKGAIEADAALAGYGGFYIVDTTMYYFLGKWNAEEMASFESEVEGSLNINTFELATQKFVLYLGQDVFEGHVILPKCDRDTSVVLHESHKARNEAMALLLEEYDAIAGAKAIEAHIHGSHTGASQ
jgi:hypothetical protein